MKISYKEIETINEFIDAIRIRADVFVIEQGLKPGWKPDEEDKNSMHFIAIIDDKTVATARMREIKNKEFKIERMSTIKEFRNKGIAKGLANFMVQYANKLNAKKIWMQSQVRVQKFYEKCGFKAMSQPYNLYGIEHIDMEYEK